MYNAILEHATINPIPQGKLESKWIFLSGSAVTSIGDTMADIIHGRIPIQTGFESLENCYFATKENSQSGRYTAGCLKPIKGENNFSAVAP